LHEVPSKQYVVKHGDYYIDYDNGILHSMDMPNAGTLIDYDYLEFPFRMDGSPIAVNKIGSRAMNRYMFNQIMIDSNAVDPEDMTVDGHPKQRTLDLITELLDKSKNMWGE
jgi:hypothetical protein